MRWDRLFADLEGQAEDLELSERDALVEELTDGAWGEVGWVDLLGGHVALQVLGFGRLEGEVLLANAALVHLAADRFEHVVASSAVVAVLASERRRTEPGSVRDRLGWGHVLRAVREEGEPVRVLLRDASTLEATVDVVGRDFVRLLEAAGRQRCVPFDAVAVVSLRT